MLMSGRLYIDEVDVYTKYGVYVTSGGWNELIAWAGLKSVTTNDWQEVDGVEADLDDPQLDTHEVSVSFACGGSNARLFDFVAMLSDKAYHEFNCAYIGRRFKLRLVSNPNMDYAKRLGIIKLKLADDFPFLDYEYQEPVTSLSVKKDYAIDDVYLSAYGIRVLKGTLSEVVKYPDVKKNMLRNISTQAGAIYDGEGAVTYKSKDVKLTCLLRADTLEELWRDYLALLYNLVQPGERMLYVAEFEQEFPCYYKSCSVSTFNPTGRPWLQFTFTVTLTRDFRIDTEMVLATEDGVVVITETDEEAVNLTPDSYYS